MRRIISSAAVFTALVATSQAFAGIVNLPVSSTTIMVNGASPLTLAPGAPQWNPGTAPTDTASYWDVTPHWDIPMTNPISNSSGGATVTNASQQYDPDPSIGYSYTITNTTGSPMIISTFNTVPFPTPFYGPTHYRGSIGISLTDLNGDGASITDDAGHSIYLGSIDGSPVLELLNQTSLPGPFNVPQSFNFSFGDAFGSHPDNAAAGPFSGGPSVLSTMTISFDFVLSPFDSVAITSNLVVTPEPTSLALLGLGAVGLLKRRRS